MEDNKYTKKHKDELGLQIPKDYFKTSKAEILNQIKEESTKKETPIFNIKRVIPYAIVASLVVFIGFTFFYTKTNQAQPKVALTTDFFEFNDNDSPVNVLFIGEANVDNYVDEFLEENTLADLEAMDSSIENTMIELLFEADTLIDNQLDDLVFNTVI